MEGPVDTSEFHNVKPMVTDPDLIPINTGNHIAIDMYEEEPIIKKKGFMDILKDYKYIIVAIIVVILIVIIIYFYANKKSKKPSYSGYKPDLPKPPPDLPLNDTDNPTNYIINDSANVSEQSDDEVGNGELDNEVNNEVNDEVNDEISDSELSDNIGLSEDNTSVYNTSVYNPIVDNTSVDNTSVDNTSVDNTSVDNTSVDNTSVYKEDFQNTPKPISSISPRQRLLSGKKSIIKKTEELINKQPALGLEPQILESILENDSDESSDISDNESGWYNPHRITTSDISNTFDNTHIIIPDNMISAPINPDDMVHLVIPTEYSLNENKIEEIGTDNTSDIMDTDREGKCTLLLKTGSYCKNKATIDSRCSRHKE